MKKSLFCTYCSNPLEDDGTCKMCPPQKQSRSQHDKIDLQCAWNDHGDRCTAYGTCAQTTNGSGPWYCSDHFSQLMGWKAWKAAH